MTREGRTLTVACPCAGTPHEEDIIVFRRVLPLAGGIAAISAMREGVVAHGNEIDGLALAEHLFPVYLTHAVESWTFDADDGSPLPLSEGDAALPFDVKYAIADAADDLFGEEVTRPLAAMISKSSRSGPTASSTSQSRSSGRSPRSRSARSSRNGTAASDE